MKQVSSLCFLLTALSLVITSYAWTQAVTTPRTASPAATVSQTIGISTVTVDYSRPAVRGRGIWGDLVPYGWNQQGFGNNNSAPWRAGANENTTVKFSHDAMVEGKLVPAGKYGLFFTINSDDTGEVILSKDNQSWGSFFYEPERDQVRTNITIRSHAMTELLTFEFINLNKNSGELVLNWENKQFPVRIEFAVDDIVMATAHNLLKGTTGFTWQGFNSAANYALQNNTHLDQALQWADQAITMDRNFTTLMTKAGLLKAKGNAEKADMINEEALKIGTEAELNAYGYQLLNQNDFEGAIHIFKVNTKNHPESANAWDSLGEGYALKGDKENAIKCFKTSLSLNPEENVKANSMKYLKKLGGT